MPVLRWRPLFLACVLAVSPLALGGCGGRPAVPAQQTPAAAPTLASIFGEQPTPAPAPTRATAYVPALPTPDATVVAQATLTALDANQLIEVMVYNDTLSPDWSLSQSFQTDIDLQSRGFTAQGRYAIKAQPQYTTGSLFFTLNRTASQTFRRNRVQAVRLYLSGGSQPIDNEGMTVSVVGSNLYPYWVANDTSVKIEGRVTDDQPIFSESRLIFLGVNTAIPAKRYVEVTVWLDSLLYDPSYTYLTGFYMKTDKQSVPTFYVDQVSLLLAPATR